EAQQARRRFELRTPARKEEPRPAGASGDVITLWHRFAAEAFVSLDMAAEGIDFLRRDLASARSDAERLSASIVLAQLFLLTARLAAHPARANWQLPLSGEITRDFLNRFAMQHLAEQQLRELFGGTLRVAPAR